MHIRVSVQPRLKMSWSLLGCGPIYACLLTHCVIVEYQRERPSVGDVHVRDEFHVVLGVVDVDVFRRHWRVVEVHVDVGLYQKWVCLVRTIRNRVRVSSRISVDVDPRASVRLSKEIMRSLNSLIRPQ